MSSSDCAVISPGCTAIWTPRLTPSPRLTPREPRRSPPQGRNPRTAPVNLPQASSATITPPSKKNRSATSDRTTARDYTRRRRRAGKTNARHPHTATQPARIQEGKHPHSAYSCRRSDHGNHHPHRHGEPHRPGHHRRFHAYGMEIRPDSVPVRARLLRRRHARRPFRRRRLRRLREEPPPRRVRQSAGLQLHEYRPFLHRFDHHPQHNRRDQPAEFVPDDRPHRRARAHHDDRRMGFLVPYQPVDFPGVSRHHPDSRHRAVRDCPVGAPCVRAGLPYV